MTSLGERAAVALRVLRTAARVGRPRHALLPVGGLGDDLLYTVVARELRERGGNGIWIVSKAPELFAGSPDVEAALDARHDRPRLFRALGARVVRATYGPYDPITDRDRMPPRHAAVEMCALAGVRGRVQVAPSLPLSEQERASALWAQGTIVIQSTVLGAVHPMMNKEWYSDRWQEVVRRLARDWQVAQVGASSDPLLVGVTDARGRSLRETAAILFHASAYVGASGFHMHLARAVGCRSVVVYGGREAPWQTGYPCNVNLYTALDCAPCGLRNTCPYDRECMRRIGVNEVVAAVKRQIARKSEPLEVETAEIPVV